MLADQASRQRMASPGNKSALVMFGATLGRLSVVMLVPSSQHMETNPEQSCLYPSQQLVWLQGTFLSTHAFPLATMVFRAMHCNLSSDKLSDLSWLRYMMAPNVARTNSPAIILLADMNNRIIYQLMKPNNFSFKIDTYSVEVRYVNKQIIITAYSETFDRCLEGHIKDTDFPEKYRQIYGATDNFIETLLEWKDYDFLIELTDIGNIIFYYEIPLPLKAPHRKVSVTHKLQLRLSQASPKDVNHRVLSELREVKRDVASLREETREQFNRIKEEMQHISIHFAAEIRKLEQLLKGPEKRDKAPHKQPIPEKFNKLIPMINIKTQFEKGYSIEGLQIKCTKAAGKWLPICLDNPIVNKEYFEVQCLQEPGHVMIGLISQDLRPVEGCHKKVGSAFLHSFYGKMELISNGVAQVPSSRKIRAGQVIRVILDDNKICWEHVASNDEKMGNVYIAENMKLKKMYPCIMAYSAGEIYRFM